MGRPKGSKNRPKSFTFSQPINNEDINYMAKEVTNFEGNTVTLTDEPGKVQSGKIIEDFSINVTTKDEDGKATVHYSNDSEPFEWEKVDSIGAVLKAEGAEIGDDVVAFIADALKGEKDAKAVAKVVDIYNATTRANAKQNAYQKVVNAKKPMSEDDKTKAFERMVETFANINKVSRDAAREALKSLMS